MRDEHCIKIEMIPEVLKEEFTDSLLGTETAVDKNPAFVCP
jgi:hypothetical protein